MGFKDMMAGIRERKKEKKETFQKMNDQVRMEEIILDRKKSANERELEQYMKEDREAEIKIRLNQVRKEIYKTGDLNQDYEDEIVKIKVEVKE